MAVPQVTTTLEDGNLAQAGSNVIDNTFLFVGNAQKGIVGTVSLDGGGTSTATITADGDPHLNPNVKIKISDAGLDGSIGEASIQVSWDGGSNYGSSIVTAATMDIGNGVGLTLDDSAGANAYVLDDTFSFTISKTSTPLEPLLVTRNNYKTVFGSGKLVDFLEVFFNTAVNGITPAQAYAIRPEASNSGSLSSVDATQTGSGSFGVSGDPTTNFSAVVKIVQVGGQSETAKYQYSTDGGINWSDVFTTPASGTSISIGYGVTISFTDSTDPSWVVGDTFEFTATAPYGNILKALTDDLASPVMRDSVKYLGKFSAIIFTEETDFEDWIDIKTLLNDLDDAGFYAWTMQPAKAKTSVQTVQDWKDAVISESSTFFDKRQCLVMSYIDTSTQTDISAVAVLAGRYATIGVNRDAKRVKFGMVSEILNVNNFNDLRAFWTEMDSERLTFVMDYAGYDGYYFANSNLLSGFTSDYKYIPDIRVAFKARRLAREKGITFLGDDVQALPGVLESIGEVIRSHIQNNMVGEVTGINVEVTSSLEDLANLKKIVMKITINKRLVIDSLEISVGYEQPTT